MIFLEMTQGPSSSLKYFFVYTGEGHLVADKDELQ